MITISNQSILERQAAELALLQAKMKARVKTERVAAVVILTIIAIALAL